MGTVLIVDDEYVIADILGWALEDEGYVVIKTTNARKGLDILERDRPSLVITDYMMPGMNGAEFAQAIRGKHDFSHIPIILMTGAQGREGRSSPELFTRVFDKPFDTDLLVAAVAELLARGPE